MSAVAPNATIETSASLPLSTQAAYGIGQVAGQAFRDIPALLLLFFMTNALGIGPALAGAAIFVPKLVWGVICDVGVGVVSDRVRPRLPRRWWLLFGAIGAPIAMIALFHVPQLSEQGKAAYVTAVFSFYMLVFAVFSVPYLAIASELSSDSHQRTVLMAWRLVFTAVGVLIADSLVPIFIQNQGGGQAAYEQASYILAAICSVTLLVAFWGAGAASRGISAPAAAPPARVSFREMLSALRSPDFSVLVTANLVQLVGAGSGYGAMLYFLTYNIGRADAFVQIGLITIISCATIIASQPAWVYLARRFGKKPVYVVASLAYGAVMSAWSILGPLGIEFSYGLAVLLGVFNSGWTLMGFSMVSDLSGQGRSGLYSSIWIAADKIGFALGGTLLVGLVLATFGFDSARAVAGLSQPASALTGVMIAFGIVPGVTSALAALLFARWGTAVSAQVDPLSPNLNAAPRS